MKYIKSIFKISIVLLLLLISVGSIYAADNGQSIISDDTDENFSLDDDFEEEDLDDEESDLDDDFEEEDLDDEESDLDDDFEEEDFDDNESDFDDDSDYSDFDFLKFKIYCYLDNYGNSSNHLWTSDDEFLNESRIYFANHSDYTLNESKEGYETYLKIYDSIISTFSDYNLTENETDYLKFMVIFYLNHYGNVSDNYTWNESESFANFTLPMFLTGMNFAFGASAPDSDNAESDLNTFISSYGHIYNPVYNTIPVHITNSTDVNHTSSDNQTIEKTPEYWTIGLLLLILLAVLAIFIVL